MEIVKLLLATGNAHPEYQDLVGNSALISACKNNNLDIVKLLLDTGNTHPEYQDSRGRSALILSCIHDNSTEIVRKMRIIRYR